MNDAGATIEILLDDTAVGNYSLTDNFFGDRESTYTTGNISATSNPDADTTTTGSDIIGSVVQIMSFNTSNNTINGSAPVLAWYRENVDGDYDLYGVMEGPVFENVPVTFTGPSISTGGDFNISATVDGAAFNPDQVSLSSAGGSSFIVASSSTTQQNMTLNIPENPAVGTYDLANPVQGYSMGYSAGSTSYSVTEGQLVVTAADNAAGTVSGTFSFTGTAVFGGSGTVSVTNGTFSIE